MPTTESRTVALLGPTNLDWVVSTFGLSRAGYTVLTLSPRLSSQAMVQLMQETECQCLIYYPSSQLLPTVDQVKAATAATTISMMSRRDYGITEINTPPFVREVDVKEEKLRYAAIVHSSGSTGLPKPIYCKHTRFTTPYVIGSGDRDLFTLPLYHIFAFQISFAHMYQRKTVFFLNPDLPLTCEGLTAAIGEAKPSALCAVPYTLKLLGEQQTGIDALKTCEQVVSTGSQCPDDIGDFLVEQGVNLATFMGATECGYTGTSLGRAPDDKAWNFIRIPPPLMKHIWPKPISEDTFEFVYLKGYPTRTVSNSNDPQESFHSSDLFTPHNSIPGAWRFLGRLDDRVTLINGEKVLPIPIEGRIRKANLVKEAVVFGIGRSIPGLLLFRAETARDITDEAFASAVWPEIDISNGFAESFSRISRDMVVPLPAGIEIPTTDKGSIIRAQLYKTFEREIDDAYARLDGQNEGNMKLNLPDLEQYLLKLAQQVIGPQVSNLYDDLFTLGMNSLQAIQLRGIIVRDLDLGGNGRKLSQVIAFEQGNLENLSKYLDNLRLNMKRITEKPVEVMKDLISRYSVAGKPREGPFHAPGSNVIVLTGATGGLGAHILSLLLPLPHISKVYILLRGPNPKQRLHATFSNLHLPLPLLTSPKLSILTSTLHSPHLGLSETTYTSLLEGATHIIHCAWPVTFTLTLSAFCFALAALRNLLQLSLEVKAVSPAHFLFCSSISVALGKSSFASSDFTPQITVPGAPISDLTQASRTGYAQSKLVAENIIANAVRDVGANATILRIGQIVGDTDYGWWNDSEILPMIIRSALTMGILPELDMSCEWLPVDVLARSILQIGGLDNDDSSLPQRDGQLVYNLVSPHSFRWTMDLLPALSAAGLSFRPVSFETWVHRLRSLSLDISSTTHHLLRTPTTASDTTTSSSSPSTSDTSKTPAANPLQNPALKLVDFFEGPFQSDNAAGGGKGIKFETEGARKVANALRDAPKIIESGLLGKMVSAWLQRWREEAEGKGNER